MGRWIIATVLVTLGLAMMGCVGPAKGQTKVADLSTPTKTLAAFLDAVESEDAGRVRRTLAATTPHSLALADDYAVFMAMDHRRCRVIDKQFLGRLQTGRWGDQARVEASRTALGKVKFKINGNRANAVFPDETGETEDTAEVALLSREMVRKDGQWKINMDGLDEYKDYPLSETGESAPMFYLFTRGLKAMDGLLTDVEAGKFATYDDFEKALSPLEEKVSNEVEKELETTHTRPAKK